MLTCYLRQLATCLMLAAQVVLAEEKTTKDAATPIEYVRKDWQQQGPGLGTTMYQPSPSEQPYFDRLMDDQRQTGGLAGPYDITRQQGKFVGWFGVVREVAEDAKAKRTTLTIEHKYFDGLTDTHILALSFNGSGDFVAELNGIDSDIEPLTLVKVYGQVGEPLPDGRPKLQTVYVRNWLWGAYTFLMAAGEQHGSDVWRKLNKIPLDRIYDPHPRDEYYVARLGPLPAAVLARRDAKLLRAAGPVGPELNTALSALIAGYRDGSAFTQTKTFIDCCAEIRRCHGEQEAVRILLARIQSSWDNGWADELRGLVEFPEASVTQFSTMLDDPQPSIRLSAVRLLGGLGPVARSAVPLLIKRLSDQPDMRQAVIDTLYDLEDASDPVRVALVPLLKDPDDVTRIAAARCLISLGIDNGEALQILSAAVTHDKDSVQQTAISAIKELQALAAPTARALAVALVDSNEDIRSGAAEAISEIGPDAKVAVLPLAKALRDSNKYVGYYCAVALGNMGAAAEAAIPQLIEAASSEDSTIRAEVAEALGKIGTHPEQFVPVLVKMLDDEDDHVQFKAEDGLQSFKGRAEPAVPGLLKLLRTGQSDNVRWNAALALGDISHSEETVQALIAALQDSSSHVRRFAAASLGKIGADATVAQPALTKALSDPDRAAHIVAAGALIRTGGLTTEALNVLNKELTPTGSWLESMWAAEEIAAIGAPAKAAVPSLVILLSAKVDYQRASAAKALGAIGPEAREAVEALETCLKDPDAYVAAHAAAALWRIMRHPAALPGLEAALKNRAAMAQISAADSLAEIGPDAVAVVPALRVAIRDRSPDVRRAARAAIPKITGQPLSDP